MREILFKAKRTDTKEWVEGYPFPSEPGEKLNRMIIFEDIQGGSTMATVEIDPETLCQFTGLPDKNGVKIFGWDVVIVYRGWHGEKKCTVLEREGTMVLENDAVQYGLFGLEKQISVIGNIHDEVTP